MPRKTPLVTTPTMKDAPTSTLKRHIPASSSLSGDALPVSARPAGSSSSPSRKRKRSGFSENVGPDHDGTPAPSRQSKKEPVEKRLKVYRKRAPQSFLEKLQRAQTQRMIVIGRTRTGTTECPSEDIDIVGTTGNIYTVSIDKVPSCTCPDSQKGNECKHKVYALSTVLRASYELQYQRALLAAELRSIFANAPAIPTDVVGAEDSKDGTRKPVEGECPICYMDFDGDNNELVWCKAACGNNIHKSCFERWSASQKGQVVKCVYCRTPWEMDITSLHLIKGKGTVNDEGYVNVAEQLGMPQQRDYSSYYPHWVRRTMGMGW